MIDFNKNSVWNLKPISIDEVRKEVTILLISGESVVAAFKTIRDQLVFTNKRIISIDVQGLTGARKSFASLPYSKIQFFRFKRPDSPKSCRIRNFFSCSPTALRRLLNLRET